MKYLKYNLFIITVLIVLCTGCQKDFLDLNPVATPTEVSFYKDSAAVDETVIGAYAELCAREVFDKDYYMTMGSIPADDVDCGGQNLSDYPMAQHFDQFTHTTNDNTPTTEVWQYCYKGLRLVNTVLEKMPLVKKNFPSGISDSYIAKRTGEMKFMRALYHFILMQIFGGVPIADHVIQPADFYNPRNSIKEVLTFMEKDLQDAIPALPPRYSANDVGRATKGAAQALLARIYLYESSYAENYPTDDRFTGCQNHYQDALDMAEAVITGGVYHLVTQADINIPDSTLWSRPNMKPYDAYRWLFTVTGDNSPEGIFEIQNVDDRLGYGYTRGNVMTVYQTCRWYSNNGVQTSAGGWSFNCPTQYVIDAFKNSDARESNLHSTPIAETDDPRFATTVGRVGDSIYVHNVLVRMDLSNIPSQTIGRKFECGWNEYWVDGQFTQGPFNVRLIRLGEVILEAAEAALKVGDQAKALTYVNMIRTRARNCGLTGQPADLTAVSFEDIVHERRLELTCEPYRFFDLVRWNLTGKYLNGMIPDAGTLGSFAIEFIPGKHEFWPLPVTEVQLSKDALVQYPAWQ